MRRNAGFTLIEAMVSACIVAILAGAAVPAFGPMMEHQHSSAAMNSLTTHMALARMAAITHGTPAVLCPSSDGTSCTTSTDWSGGWMVFLDRNVNRERDDGDEVIRVDLEPTSRHLAVWSTAGRRQLRYLPDGRSAGSNLTISVCSPHGELLGKVIVNNMGRPRSERPKASAPCPT